MCMFTVMKQLFFHTLKLGILNVYNHLKNYFIRKNLKLLDDKFEIGSVDSCSKRKKKTQQGVDGLVAV